jgi:hypothetical protein
VTVPTVWYLRQEGPAKPHGHEPGQDHMEDADHPEHKGESHDDAPAENEEGGDEGQGSPDNEDGVKEESGKEEDEKPQESDDSESDNGEQKDTPDSSDDEGSDNKELKDGGGDVEGVRGTAPRKDDAPGTTRESISDSKGKKKRINSDAGTKAGEAQEAKSEPDKGDKVRSFQNLSLDNSLIRVRQRLPLRSRQEMSLMDQPRGSRKVFRIRIRSTRRTLTNGRILPKKPKVQTHRKRRELLM